MYSGGCLINDEGAKHMIKAMWTNIERLWLSKKNNKIDDNNISTNISYIFDNTEWKTLKYMNIGIQDPINILGLMLSY